MDGPTIEATSLLNFFLSPLFVGAPERWLEHARAHTAWRVCSEARYCKLTVLNRMVLAGSLAAVLKADSAGSPCTRHSVPCGRVRRQAKLEPIHVGGPGPSQLEVCVGVRWQSEPDSAGSLLPSQLIICNRVSWQSVSESAGSLCPSQLAVCVRVSCGLCSSQMAVCVRGNRQSVSESVGSLCPA